MREKRLLLYKEEKKGNIISNMAWLMHHYNNEEYLLEEKKDRLYKVMRCLLEFAEQYGFYGNLWHVYLTHVMVTNENAYSRNCEIVGDEGSGISEAALYDFTIFKELFDYDFVTLQKNIKENIFSLVLDFDGSSLKSKVYEERMRNLICSLAVKLANTKDAFALKEKITKFYREYGVGEFGLHKAFRIVNENDEVCIKPILNTEQIYLQDLVGYEIPKQKLIENTEAFVSGKRANNCLLFGDAGTGKSSSIKGILNEYYEKGLRIIEVYKHQFYDLSAILAKLKNRNYKFIIYMDDLSFEEFETEYKYLKAVIEGGMENKPENVIIYATSNRRHLIKEKHSDKEGRRDSLHSSDTVQEKLSLVARFGVTIFFGAPDRKEFQNIVKILAEKHNIVMPEEVLVQEANRWEMSHGGLSGRTAQQFINYLLGKQ